MVLMLAVIHLYVRITSRDGNLKRKLKLIFSVYVKLHIETNCQVV